jgi:tRNA(fMet)-specific endonuclease VapC
MQNLINIFRDRIVLDTDVVSFIYKEKTQAKFFYPHLQNRVIAVSFISIGELFHGAYHDNWGENRMLSLERHLENYLILEYDYPVCLRWAAIKHECEQNGHPISDSDCWIAACAMHHHCSLATNNTRHFNHVNGLSLITPDI